MVKDKLVVFPLAVASFGFQVAFADGKIRVAVVIGAIKETIATATRHLPPGWANTADASGLWSVVE